MPPATAPPTGPNGVTVPTSAPPAAPAIAPFMPWPTAPATRGWRMSADPAPTAAPTPAPIGRPMPVGSAITAPVAAPIAAFRSTEPAKLEYPSLTSAPLVGLLSPPPPGATAPAL